MSTYTSGTGPDDGRHLQHELDRLADRPATLLNQEYWFPLALFGLLSVGSAFVFRQWDPATTVSWIYGAVLGPLGGLATGAWFAVRGGRLGIEPHNPAVYAAIGTATTLGSGAVGALVDAPWTYPLVMVVVGVANVALGLVDRSSVMAIVGTGLALMGIIGGVGEVSNFVFGLAVGGFMVAAAGAIRGWR